MKAIRSNVVLVLSSVFVISCGTGVDIHANDTGSAAVTSNGYSLTLSSTNPAGGSTLSVTYTQPVVNTIDAIALAAAGTANSTWITSKLTGGANPVSLTVPTTAGNYEIRYIVKAGFVEEAVVPFCVGTTNCAQSPPPPPPTGYTLTPTTTNPMPGTALKVPSIPPMRRRWAQTTSLDSICRLRTTALGKQATRPTRLPPERQPSIFPQRQRETMSFATSPGPLTPLG